CQQESDWPWTF
nr:immunoglobulin light chain junction region [Macaca mulatta]MOW51787.1 immunoglobulin light chain junction region [Macaca mulatta]MOW51921.1 immunoglobulin light chain junction region [Macaca mulatta]MOW52947.1 immunoglobulin light chain junction region [Macaca mulatta]MOW53505.1 immunoglobulin light chain junction region [Macaca mulatta]